MSMPDPRALFQVVTLVRCSRLASVVVAAVVLLAAAGCGGKSIDKLVGEKYDGSGKCRAVGLTELGKLYSCQTGRGTRCVIRDGEDVFSGLAEAQRVGLSC